MTVPTEAFGEMELFGYVNRLDMLLEESALVRSRRRAGEQRRKLALWCLQHDPKGALGPSPVAIRFLRGTIRSSRAPFAIGPWRKPALSELPADQVFELDTFSLERTGG
jgi:hypothetical protein